MAFRNSIGLKDEFLVVHSGNMGVKQGLEVILGAAQLSRNDNSLQYLIVGDGAVREKLQSEARNMRLENVRFLPLLSNDQYRELLTATDVSLVTQKKCVADIVFPSKVITLMASGQAIVASVSHTSEVALVLNKGRAGLVVPAEDSVSLLDAVTVLRNDDSLRREIASNAREFAHENWNKDIILARMEVKLRSLVVNQDLKAPRNWRIWSTSRPKANRAGSFAD
jgi:colanic acid biosynthesis glycosyl transferase WcaI